MKVAYTPGSHNCVFFLNQREKEHVGSPRAAINFLKGTDDSSWAVIAPSQAGMPFHLESGNRTNRWRISVPKSETPRMPHFGSEELKPKLETHGRLIVPKPTMQMPIRQMSPTKRVRSKVIQPSGNGFDVSGLARAVDTINEAKDEFKASLVLEVDEKGYLAFLLRVGR